MKIKVKFEANELLKLYSLMSELISINAPLEKVLNETMEQIAVITGADHAIIFLLDENSLNAIHGYNINTALCNLALALYLGEDAFGLAAAYRQPIVANTSETPLFNFLDSTVLNLKFESVAVMPVIYKEECLGVMTLFFKYARDFHVQFSLYLGIRTDQHGSFVSSRRECRWIGKLEGYVLLA